MPSATAGVPRRRFRRSPSCGRVLLGGQAFHDGLQVLGEQLAQEHRGDAMLAVQTTVDGMTVVGYLPPKAIMVRIDGRRSMDR